MNSFDFQPEHFKNKSVSFYYKGTAHPVVVDIPDLDVYMMKMANKMIVDGMKCGDSIEKQKIYYKEQLDYWEKTIYEQASGGEITEDVLERVANILKISKDSFYNMWCLNICALLKLKVINDDNNNGILCVRMV